MNRRGNEPFDIEMRPIKLPGNTSHLTTIWIWISIPTQTERMAKLARQFLSVGPHVDPLCSQTMYLWARNGNWYDSILFGIGMKKFFELEIRKRQEESRTRTVAVLSPSLISLHGPLNIDVSATRQSPIIYEFSWETTSTNSCCTYWKDERYLIRCSLSSEWNG